MARAAALRLRRRGRGVGVKAKIGYPTPQEDREAVRSIRSAAGSQMAIMVDYNQSLAPADAIVRLRMLEGEGLIWIEEPTQSHDFAGHAAIAREIQTPIQAGENWWGPLDVRQALDAGASDYLMLDAMKIGGVTGWMRAAVAAGACRVRISSHLWPEWSAQMLSATAGAHWLEYSDWWNPIFANRSASMTVTRWQVRLRDPASSGMRRQSPASPAEGVFAVRLPLLLRGFPGCLW